MKSSGQLEAGDVKAVAASTQRNFDGPIQTIIPWAGNLYTDTLIARARAELGERLLGLLDAGRNVRGRHGVYRRSAPQTARTGAAAGHHERDRGASWSAPCRLRWSRWFTISRINESGTQAELLEADSGLMPPEYYALLVPGLLRVDPALLPLSRRAELACFNEACQTVPRFRATVRDLFDSMLPRSGQAGSGAR